MIVPTLIMALLAAVLLYIGYHRGRGEDIQGLRQALDMTLQTLPLLIFAYIVAGMIPVLIPREIVSKWIGHESGMRGILIGTIAGGITPGGPFVSLPIVAVMLKGGASVGTLVAFLSGWSLIAMGRLPLEIGILGWKLTFIRLGSSFFLPLLAGWLAQFFFGSVKL